MLSPGRPAAVSVPDGVGPVWISVAAAQRSSVARAPCLCRDRRAAENRDVNAASFPRSPKRLVSSRNASGSFLFRCARARSNSYDAPVPARAVWRRLSTYKAWWARWNPPTPICAIPALTLFGIIARHGDTAVEFWEGLASGSGHGVFALSRGENLGRRRGYPGPGIKAVASEDRLHHRLHDYVLNIGQGP